MVGRALLSRLGAVARSPRWSLGSLSVADLALGAEPAVAAVTDALPAVLSLFAGTLSAALGGALTWLVFAVGYYHAADRIYRPRFGFPADDPWFRALVAGCGVGVGWALTDGWSVAAAVLAPLATATLVGVLVGRYGWTLTHPDGEGVAVLDAFTPRGDYTSERRRNHAAGGPRRALSTAFTFVSVVVLLGTPLLLLAFATLVLLLAYPLPEVVLVCWAGAGLLARVLPARIRHRLPDLRSPAALESDLYGVVGRAMRNAKGTVLTIASLLGAATGALLFSAATLQLTALGSTAGVHRARLALAVVGLVLTAAAGAYLLLFWGVELARLPAFMDHWAGVDDPGDPPVGRLPGASLPVVPAVPLFVGTALAIGRDAPLPVVRALLGCWLAVGLTLVVTVVPWRAGRAVAPTAGEDPVAGEDHYVAAGALALLAALSTLAYRDGLLVVLGGGPLPEPRGLLVVPVAVLLLGLVYMNDAQRIGHEADAGPRRFALALFGTGLGTMTVLTAQLASRPWRGRATLVGIIVGCLGVLAAVGVLADAHLPGPEDTKGG